MIIIYTFTFLTLILQWRAEQRSAEEPKNEMYNVKYVVGKWLRHALIL